MPSSWLPDLGAIVTPVTARMDYPGYPSLMTTVFIVNCQGATPHVPEKFIDDRWQPVWGALIPLCLSSPITVPKDSSYRTPIGMFGGQFTEADPTGGVSLS